MRMEIAELWCEALWGSISARPGCGQRSYLTGIETRYIYDLSKTITNHCAIGTAII